MSLVNAGIPEYNTHIAALRLSEGEHQSLREVAPHVVRLNVSEEDVRVYSKANTHAKAFPAEGVDYTAVRRYSETTDMLARRRVELDSSFVALRSVEEGSSYTKHVSIGVPLDALNEHASVNQDGHVISEILHKLKSTTLVSYTE